MTDPASGRGISRREFTKAAVAIGGAAALSACTEREEAPDIPTGPDDLSAFPARQHAWNDALTTDEHGNHVPPRHHVLVFLDYAGDGTPDDPDREQVEAAFRNLERAYQRGSDGLLFTAGYSPAYFGRYDAALPDSARLQEPRALTDLEDPELDQQDAVVHLASDYAQVVIGAEEALLGNRDALNGVDIETDVSGVLEKVDRRTGFIGDGLPAENQDVVGIPDSEPVPEDAPLYMGFESGFEKNQASEDRVTIPDGPFAGGTNQQLSKIRLHLQQWYEQDSREQRVSKMFCPAHAEEDRVEGTGENLGNDSGVGECADDVMDNSGVVGHAQKAARARDNDDSPIMLRRDFDSTDGGAAGLHFLSLQRSIADFVETREQMTGDDVADNTAVGTINNNGIKRYMTVQRRGNFLLPPRSSRALPTPQPDA
ncbi:deferrochelatase/peroxidase EfeB [Natronoarchaeum philippinense]|uniref:Deferrochelatase/peroxidase EfeB n=1 Tax=Natronoarchaeum philippinense TaxID=558529 RepID=A0A285N2T8_NATPI|nr:Dyp-type peroxidase domain-containing protein [Natronoarchaeum philippinense]SNZ03784.1 deferrochelatase/peroxidase EfeB [Natronoarchaeum philippinense]